MGRGRSSARWERTSPDSQACREVTRQAPVSVWNQAGQVLTNITINSVESTELQRLMKLIFNEYNGHYCLAQIWKEEDNIGRFTTSPAEIEMSTGYSPQRADRTTDRCSLRNCEMKVTFASSVQPGRRSQKAARDRSPAEPSVKECTLKAVLGGAAAVRLKRRQNVWVKTRGPFTRTLAEAVRWRKKSGPGLWDFGGHREFGKSADWLPTGEVRGHRPLAFAAPSDGPG